MQFFKKAVISILLVLAIIVAPICASVNVTWEWILDDTEVQYFRYQLEGEAVDGWTVVTSDVTSYELMDVDGSVSHTLYLQQSYDGENWSASAYATSTPIVPSVPVEPVAVVEPIEEPVAEVATVEEPVAEVTEPAPVIEEPVAVVEEPVAVVEEPVVEPETVAEVEPVVEPVVEEAVVEEIVEPVVAEPAPVVEETTVPEIAPVVAAPVAPKARANNFAMTLDFGAGAFYRFNVPATSSLDSNLAIKANLGFGLENIIRIGNNHGIGLWFDIFGILDNVQKQPAFGDYFKLSNYGKELGVDALLTYNFSTEHFKLIVGGGADFRLLPSFASGSFSVFKKNIDWGYNIVGQIQARWQINDLFSMGIAGNYAYNIKHNVHEVGGIVSLGFSF